MHDQQIRSLRLESSYGRSTVRNHRHLRADALIAKCRVDFMRAILRAVSNEKANWRWNHHCANWPRSMFGIALIANLTARSFSGVYPVGPEKYEVLAGELPPNFRR
ncbi:MAG: hypothetical protein AAF515_06930 [Pseudomonadota bacterium]